MEPALFLVFVVVVTIMISLGCAIWFCDHGLPFPWAVGGGACCGVFLVTKESTNDQRASLMCPAKEGRPGLGWSGKRRKPMRSGTRTGRFVGRLQSKTPESFDPA